MVVGGGGGCIASTTKNLIFNFNYNFYLKIQQIYTNENYIKRNIVGSKFLLNFNSFLKHRRNHIFLF